MEHSHVFLGHTHTVAHVHLFSALSAVCKQCPAAIDSLSSFEPLFAACNPLFRSPHCASSPTPLLSSTLSQQYSATSTLHTTATMLSRACHLLGTLCRPSDRCYSLLSRYQLVPSIAQLPLSVSPPISELSKSVAFFIGNSCFHSASLLPDLVPSCSMLVSMLADPSPKVRLNAGGALGNLCRHVDAASMSQLDQSLMQSLLDSRAVGKLLAMASNPSGCSDVSIGANSIQFPSDDDTAEDSSLACRRIALFTLGNLCVFSPVRQLIRTNESAVVRLQELLRNEGSSSQGNFRSLAYTFVSTDEKLSSMARRVLTKLGLQ